MPPKRGEIWWVSLDPTLGSEISKTRPCLIVGRNAVNELRRTVVVLPLSSSPAAHPPVTVRVTCMDQPAVAVVDQIRAVSKQRLMERAGSLPPKEMASVDRALREILDLVSGE